MQRPIIFAEGRYGEQVATQFGAGVSRLTDSLDRLDLLIAGAEFVGVALWRRYSEACDLLDAACHRHAVPWSAVVLDGTSLTSGPLIVPGHSACFRCYRRRWLTHVQSVDRELALERAWGADAALGVAGFTPSAVAMGVASLQLDGHDMQRAAGRVRRFQLLTGDFLETRTVRVHACPRCSTTRPGVRFTEHLKPALAEVVQ